MNEAYPEYGLWWAVAINSLVFIAFAFGFFRPKSPRDWRSFGAFSAFLVALFTEMYGFPLTIYLVSGWLAKRFPEIDWFAHDSGHLLEMMFGWGGDPHVGPFHMLSSVFVLGGFILLALAWRVLYRAQRRQRLAMTGAYALVRHPQYLAFGSIMFGFLLQWPTLPTVVMFPILVFMYLRLAQREEEQALAEFGEEYGRYRRETPAWFPRFGSRHRLRVTIALLLVFPTGIAVAYLLEPDSPADAALRIHGPDRPEANTATNAATVRRRGPGDAPHAWNRHANEPSDATWRRNLIRAHFDTLHQLAGHPPAPEAGEREEDAQSRTRSNPDAVETGQRRSFQTRFIAHQFDE